MRISDWSSDVCSSDLLDGHPTTLSWLGGVRGHRVHALGVEHFGQTGTVQDLYAPHRIDTAAIVAAANAASAGRPIRSEEHTSELQSLMRISYAVFCLKTHNSKSRRT